MNKKDLRLWATSFTTLMFVVIGLSGVMMYIDWGKSYVKDLHEILGLAFVVFALVHVYVNWGAMKGYFSKKIFYTACVATAVVSAFFVVSVATSTQVSPKGLALQSIMQNDLKDALKVMKIDYDGAKVKLQEKHSKNLDDYNSLAKLGKDLNTNAFGAISILID